MWEICIRVKADVVLQAFPVSVTDLTLFAVHANGQQGSKCLTLSHDRAIVISGLAAATTTSTAQFSLPRNRCTPRRLEQSKVSATGACTGPDFGALSNRSNSRRYASWSSFQRLKSGHPFQLLVQCGCCLSQRLSPRLQLLRHPAPVMNTCEGMHNTLRLHHEFAYVFPDNGSQLVSRNVP